MFSTTMMASSTTSPIASTMASRVSRFTVNPRASMTLPTPISDSGTATAGMTVERNEPRKRKITATTINRASIRVVSTWRMASRT